MAKIAGSLFRLLRQYGAITAVSVLTLVALIMLSQSLQQAATFAESYMLLLMIAIGGLVVLLGLLMRTGIRLWRGVRTHRPGSRITLRLAALITTLVGVPILIIYLFALQFILQGIDAWFDVKTETALKNATEVVQLTFDSRSRNLLKLAREGSVLFQDELQTTPAVALEKLRALLDAEEVSLYSADRQLIAFSSASADVSILPQPIPDNLFRQVRNGHPYAALEAREKPTPGRLFRIVLPVTLGNSQALLQAIVPVPDQLVKLAETTEQAYTQYLQRAYLREPLKTALTLLLSLVVLMALLSALLFSIQLVQNFTRPIRALTLGTRQVAAGKLEPLRDEMPDNELGELLRSFNDMVEQIRRARRTARISHQQSELQKSYLQTIISTLSSGVLTLDASGRLRLYNAQAEELLGVQLNRLVGTRPGQRLDQLQHAGFAELWHHLEPLLDKAAGPWQVQLEYRDGPHSRTLLIHGAPLGGQARGGHVLVIDDITDLIQAQRNAAWHEVARRLAHEIKNPLTPIQLSAERLAFKLARHLPESERNLLEKLTQTIVEQVQTMQALVDAFTDYARAPRPEKQPVDVNALLDSMAQLYQRPGLSLTLDADPRCSSLHADPNRLRQLLHNLIKNAIEVQENQDTATVTLSTRCADGAVVISVCDRGPGLPPDAAGWIFQPYATGKPKGTGLGLAIVKKIVEEHNGTIELASGPDGTCFHIHLPGQTHT